MQQRMIVHEQHPRLLLFFAGWGMDETPFLSYHPQESDLMICYDYRRLDFDDTLLAHYREIHLVAWSMGVWAASYVLQHHTLPITRSIAINGTPYPVDEERGIPPTIFNGTLQGLNAASLLKFQRRMCRDAEAYRHFQSLAPRRPWEELQEELAAIGQQYQTLAASCVEQTQALPPSGIAWEQAFIGDNDRIFPPQAQHKAWEGICPSIEHGSQAHYDYDLLQRFLATEGTSHRNEPHTTVNKDLIAKRFTKAAGTYTHEAHVQHRIAHTMIGLLGQHLPSSSPKRIVEFGCGTGIYSRLLLRSLQPEQLLLNDLCSEMGNTCSDLLGERVAFVGGDAEQLPFPQNTELITSCSTLQWFEQPEAFFRRCSHSLSAHGYFAFATFGKENMREVRQLTGNGLDYRSRQELEAALTPLYDIVYSGEELIPLTFDAPMQVLHHLKQTGVTGTTAHCWTRGSLQQFCDQYVYRFSQDSAVSLTYHPIYIIAKKKEQ